MRTRIHWLLGFLVSVTTLFIVASIGFSLWFWKDFTRPYMSKDIGRIDTLIIEPGTSFQSIAQILEDQHYIRNKHFFTLGVYLHGEQSRFQAGEYQIQPQHSPKDIMVMMTSGETVKRAFTIPEGLTSFEIVNILNKTDILEGEITDIPAEGTLLPETYHFMKGYTRQEKITRMQTAMTETIEELWPNRAKNLPFETKEDAIILASIIEKETGVGKEREKVAGVFVNRLRKGMPLQTDPTVIYALTKGQHENEGKGPLGRRLLRKDLQFDSPYNTYLYAGLPPGPIANPGRAAIKAALNPAEHDYIYFVADGTGGHAFGKTLAEHNRNVAAWRKIRAAQ